MRLDAKIPEAPIEDMWQTHREHLRLLGPRSRPQYRIIVVGTGLAGASAASSLAAMGYPVECFCFQDSPRRAHSIAAQGGINAAKDYRNDGDSVYRLFYDTQMDEVKWLSFWMYQLWGATFAVFGLIALFLAATGVYGVISYGVRARSREIGVRMAIGADRGAVVGLVVLRALKYTGMGLVIGAVLALALSVALEDLLIGVSVTDPVIYVGTMGFLGLVALAASLVPASWAASLDAVEAMRR